MSVPMYSTLGCRKDGKTYELREGPLFIGISQVKTTGPTTLHRREVSQQKESCTLPFLQIDNHFVI